MRTRTHLSARILVRKRKKVALRARLFSVRKHDFALFLVSGAIDLDKILEFLLHNDFRVVFRRDLQCKIEFFSAFCHLDADTAPLRRGFDYHRITDKIFKPFERLLLVVFKFAFKHDFV